jgi:type II secretory pathway component HofQ
MHLFQQRNAISLCTTALAVAITVVSPACAQQPTSTPENPATAAAAPPEVNKREAQRAEAAYFSGVKLLDRGDVSGAETEFAKASRIDPSKADYVQAATLAHEHRVTELVQQAGKARMLGHPDKAESLLAQARKLDPENTIVTQHTDPLPLPSSTFRPEIQSQASTTENAFGRDISTIAEAISLLPSSAQHEFHLHTDEQQVLRLVFQQYGIRAVFDDSVQHQSLRVDLEDVTYAQASDIILGMAHAFAVPLDAHSVLIAKNTTENRQRLEHQLQETIYVPGFTPEQMKEIGRIVQSVFDVKQVSIQSSGGNISVRAPENTLSAINLTLADLVDGGAEVVLDISLYTVDRTRQRQIGAQLPQQLGIYNVQSAAHDLVTSNQSLVNQGIAQGLIPANANDITIALALISSGLVQSSLLANTIGFFGGGLTATGITTNASTTFHLSLSSNDTRALDSIKLRLGDRQTGTFRSGTRYPIITSTYTSGIAGLPSSLAGVTVNGVSAQSLIGQNSSTITIPQIQFEDLGLTLKATPTVQRSGQIAMQLDLKIEALASNSLNGIPVLANSQYVSTVTVKDGESALLASSLSQSESAAISGLPGISELPGFQTATADKTTSMDTSELVLLITPHVVRHRSSISAGPRIAFEQRLPN